MLIMPHLRSLNLSAISLLAVCVLTHSRAMAQSVGIPLPRLLTTTPMGAQAGTTVDITISGDSLDEAGELVFTHAGIKASPKRDASGATVPNQYTIAVAPDCPLGIYEARVMSRLGVSSSRVFSVDSLPEVTRTAANTTLATALDLQVDSICNANVTAKAVDHYRFSASTGQRIIVHCAARSIDSKLDAVLIIGDEAGRDLKVERRGGLIDFTVPADGKYTIKVHDLTFNGGPAYFYRLSLRQLPTDAALPQFATTQSVSAFSWPPSGLAAVAGSQEIEPNQDHSDAQKINLPCDISGSFFPAADVDMFEFAAKKGEVWWIEVASERLGRPTDPAIVVQLVEPSTPGDANSPPKFTDVAELSDIPSPMKTSSNGYAYDGPPFNGGSADILGKLEIQQDGIYHLQLSDLFGGTRKDPRNVYRLIIRQAQPDFALVAWGIHMELRNGDRAALSKPIALRGGQTVALEVVTVRRDGFDGPIELAMDGLPAGVTAQGITIPAGKSRGIMLVTADVSAPPALVHANFVGRAETDGQAVSRSCRLAEMTWPVPDAWSEIPTPRLVSSVPVSVSAAEQAPLTIAAKEKNVIEVAAGQKAIVPLVLTRRTDFSGTVIQLRTFGETFERAPQFDVPITADSAEAVLDTAALGTPPGDYVVAFYGGAIAKYQDNPGAVLAARAAQKTADEAVKGAEAEVQLLSTQLASAAAEQKASLEQQLTVAKATHQEAVSQAKVAADRVQAATDRATAKDTVDIVVSEPITIRVK
jgi:hypothetical protein